MENPPSAPGIDAPTGNGCFLGVACSLSGKRWAARLTDDRASLAMAQRLGVPEIVGRVLSARGIGLEEADDFLNPTLKRLLPDPHRLKDMETACERLASAVMQGEQIAVFGDYDVDGATSSALLSRFFSAVGASCRIYIPDRLSEGYGPNKAALLNLRKEGVSIVITVDCGTNAHEPLKAAASSGLDVIVVDHHEAEALLPDAVAVVNPNRMDEDGANGQMAAVGVTFLLAVGLNRTLRDAGWYANRTEPDLIQWLDLVALGTVCDAVRLTGVNRAMVAQGLKVLARRNNPGLKALIDIAGIGEAPGAYHASFVLGPRINAGGRIGTSNLGARLLSTDDSDEALDIAHRLDDLNRERREIEAAVLEQALAQAAENGADGEGEAVVFAVGEGWHQGVIGIVASRLKERFGRPACVISLDGSKGVGSGRSVSGVDLGATVIAAQQAGLLTRGGGHAMAAGFSVQRDRIGEFRRFLCRRMAASIADAADVPGLFLDGTIKAAGASLDMIQTLERLEPYGAGNPEPVFAIPAARLDYASVAGENHLRCTLTDDGGGRLNAIAFRSLDTQMGQALIHHDGASFHIAGKLRANTWKGRTSAQLVIDDAAPAG